MTTSLNYCSVWGEKNMNTFIQQAYIKLIKKLYFLLQINYVILNFLFINDSWKKRYHGFHKNLKRDNFPVFKIDKYFDKVDKVIKIDKEKLFVEHQISTLEWFMKDRVTLKTLILIAIIFHNNAVFFIRIMQTIYLKNTQKNHILICCIPSLTLLSHDQVTLQKSVQFIL